MLWYRLIGAFSLALGVVGRGRQGTPGTYMGATGQGSLSALFFKVFNIFWVKSCDTYTEAYIAT